MTNADIVRAACRVIWTDGEVGRAGEFYADHFIADYPMTDWGEGLEGVKQLAGEIRSAFPDYREQIDQLIDAGDKIVVVLTIRGTHRGTYAGVPATGRKIEFRDVSICQLENGKIVKQSGLSDLLTLFVQLGLIEMPGR